MLQTIAYQKGLETLADTLQQKGFQLISFQADSIGYDTLLYYEDQNHLFFQQFTKSVIHHSTSNNSGALLINVCNLSAEEVVNILSRRTYTPLFKSVTSV